MRAAEGTHIVGVRGRGSGGLRLEALDLHLALGALGVARGDAVIERLAAGAQVGVVLRDVIQAGTQLGGKRLPTLERLAHLGLELHCGSCAAGSRHATVHRGLKTVEKTHEFLLSELDAIKHMVAQATDTDSAPIGAPATP